MKKILVIGCLIYLSAIGTKAQNISKAEIAKQRAERLSNQMIQELRLNNFQAKRLREINQEKVNKMMEIEQKYAHDPTLVEKNCQGVCRERDKELESFLSFDQYGKYYGNRSEFYKYDKDFARNIGLATSKNPSSPLNETIATERSVQNATASDPVLKPSTNR